jgi:hypothetical protein
VGYRRGQAAGHARWRRRWQRWRPPAPIRTPPPACTCTPNWRPARPTPRTAGAAGRCPAGALNLDIFNNSGVNLIKISRREELAAALGSVAAQWADDFWLSARTA